MWVLESWRGLVRTEIPQSTTGPWVLIRPPVALGRARPESLIVPWNVLVTQDFPNIPSQTSLLKTQLTVVISLGFHFPCYVSSLLACIWRGRMGRMKTEVLWCACVHVLNEAGCINLPPGTQRESSVSILSCYSLLGGLWLIANHPALSTDKSKRELNLPEIIIKIRICMLYLLGFCPRLIQKTGSG